MSKTWLITGSSRGLGRTLAETVLEAGHRLVATARRTESLDGLVEKYGDRVLPVPLDVTDAAAARRAVRAAVETFGRLDVVVNNAGYADMAAIEDTSDEAFREQDGKQPGDPTRISRVLLDVTEAPEPPLRLLLGRDAVAAARGMADRMAAEDAEDAEWRRVSESV